MSTNKTNKALSKEKIKEIQTEKRIVGSVNRAPFEEAYMNLMSADKYRHLSFYSFVIAKMKVKVTTSIPTAGAGFYNNTYNLLINPDFFATLPVEERVAVLIHECQHVILQHIFRKGIREHRLFNIACDIAINQFIENIPKEGMFPETFDFPVKLTAENYYNLLVDEKKDQEKEKEESGEGDGDTCESCGGSGEQEPQEPQEPQDGEGGESGEGEGKEPCESCGGSGKTPGTGWKPSNGHPDLTGQEEHTLDSHDFWDDVTGDEEDQAKDAMQRILNEAAEKSRGNTPQNVLELMELWATPPVISWKRVLKRYIASKKGSKISTIKRRDRRMPNRHDLRGKKTYFDQPSVIVGLDVSGSMSDEEINKGLSEILEVCKVTNSKLQIVQIDTDIQGLEEFDSKSKNFKRKGGGGTDMSEMARFLIKDKTSYDILIMISDMFIEDVGTHQDWRLKKPTLWLNTSGTDVSWEGIKGHKVMDISQA